MTPKERQDAIVELKDMAYEMERRAMYMDGDSFDRGRRVDRALMLRAVARELQFLNDVAATKVIA
jgi:hypothetical protein